MWKFSRAKGQRTALIHSFRLCGEEDSASSDPHIYPSVEYWTTSVFAQVLPQPSIEQTKSTPHLNLNKISILLTVSNKLYFTP